MRIAMWSGPRNLSTAMMYSFGARPDFAVWDEPFYAPYLVGSGAKHPMRDEIITRHETDPAKICDWCLGDIPASKPNFYMKHMPHHMLDGFGLDWAASCVNVHLIRHPARVVSSYGAKRDEVTLDDIGFRQQLEIYRRVGGFVIDSFDIRRDPECALKRLCDVIGLDWNPAMLTWPKGGHKDDGVWAAHWYNAVHQSEGFAGPEGDLPMLEPKFDSILDQSMPIYDELKALALRL
jgi:hypothetical protein